MLIFWALLLSYVGSAQSLVRAPNNRRFEGRKEEFLSANGRLRQGGWNAAASSSTNGAPAVTDDAWDPADAWHMECALTHAQSAVAEGEVPVGAVLVSPNGKVLARAHNRVAATSDVTAHAEIIAIREAAAAQGNWRLVNCTL